MNAALFSDSQACGVYFLMPADRANTEKAAAKLAIFQIKLAGMKSKLAVLKALGSALKFPAYYGKNFDALNDCLSNPERLPTSGAVLFIDGLQTLQTKDAASFTTLLEIFQSAVESWQTNGKPFWILLDTAFPGITALKV